MAAELNSSSRPHLLAEALSTSTKICQSPQRHQQRQSSANIAGRHFRQAQGFAADAGWLLRRVQGFEPGTVRLAGWLYCGRSSKEAADRAGEAANNAGTPSLIGCVAI